MRRLLGKIAAIVYFKRRCKLRKKRSVYIAADFVCTCVKLKLCDKEDALRVKRHLEWLHNMRR